jgi:hypothetical protein
VRGADTSRELVLAPRDQVDQSLDIERALPERVGRDLPMKDLR